MMEKQTIVVKVGTSSLTLSDGTMDAEKIRNITTQLAALQTAGHHVILVSSGAIAAGFSRLGFKKRPTKIADKQAAAAVGQGLLMEEYTKNLMAYQIPCAQILLNRSDFEDRRRYKNIFGSLSVLLGRGAIPIINENDTIAIEELKVGDTITSVTNPAKEAIAGFEDVKPMVFAGVYPVEADQYEDLRASLEKLQLNDASLTFEPESSLALGFGFRCGFLGLLHMEIIQERLYREFDMDVITTVPNVSYRITTTQGDVVEVHNPSGLPEVTKIDKIEEPYILAQIITKSEFLGNVIKLCIDKRGVMKNQTFITQDRVEVNFDMPLSEIVFDFYDKLKSISKGYASFDYHRTGFQPSKLVKLDILLNGEPVDALSSLTYTDHAYDFGRKMCEKLKELIPRQQFDIAIQAAVGAKIIARETVKAVRKDVTAKCYGGDISRKRKLLEKQKKGKKRMRQIGNVEVPQSAFLAVLKMD